MAFLVFANADPGGYKGITCLAVARTRRPERGEEGGRSGSGRRRPASSSSRTSSWPRTPPGRRQRLARRSASSTRAASHRRVDGRAVQGRRRDDALLFEEAVRTAIADFRAWMRRRRRQDRGCAAPPNAARRRRPAPSRAERPAKLSLAGRRARPPRHRGWRRRLHVRPPRDAPRLQGGRPRGLPNNQLLATPASRLMGPTS